MNHIYGDDGHLRIEALEMMIDGELTAREESMLEKHLADCAGCRAWQARLLSEQRIYAHAGRALTSEPPPIWAEISARLREEDQQRWWREWLPPVIVDRRRWPLLITTGAVSVALLLGLAMSPSRLVQRVDQAASRVNHVTPLETSIDRAPIVAPLPLPHQSGKRRRPATGVLAEKAQLMRQIRRSEMEYHKTIRLLERAIARRPDTLDPETWEQYRAGLARIDQAIATSRAALLRNPTDATAGRFVISAYAKKVELLQYIALR